VFKSFNHNRGFRNWNAEVEHIFNFIGLPHIYDSQLNCDVAQCTKLLVDKMKNEWLYECLEKPKLAIGRYIKYKDNSDSEDYVKSYMLRRKRSLLT
jgi:hypothetical protein